MGEELEAERSRPFEFHFDVEVTDDIVAAGCVAVLVSDGAVHNDLVVEELRRKGQVELVRPLVFQSDVDRYVELLQDGAQLPRHHFGEGVVEHLEVVGDSRLLVRKE